MISRDPLQPDDIAARSVGSFRLDGYTIYVLSVGERFVWVYRGDGASIQQLGVVRWNESSTPHLTVGNTLIGWVSPGSRRGDLLVAETMEVYRRVFGSPDNPVLDVDEAASSGPRDIDASPATHTRDNGRTGGDRIEASVATIGATPFDDRGGGQAGGPSGAEVAPPSEADVNTDSHCDADLHSVDIPVTAAVETPNCTTPGTTPGLAVLPIVEFKSSRHRVERRPSPYPAAVGVASVPGPVSNVGKE